MPSSVGAIKIESYLAETHKLKILRERPYFLAVVDCISDCEVSLPALGSLTLYLTGRTQQASINGQSWTYSLAQAENQQLFISLRGQTQLWLAGVSTTGLDSLLELQPEPKIVQKPWGKEIWLSGQHPHYCFKRIQIKAGHRTSLQYHQKKHETNIILKGQTKLYFRREGKLLSPNDPMITEQTLVSSPVLMDIEPWTLHRLEALTDLDFMEISTPEVDDVIRIADDKNRPNGRIHSEHQNE